MSSDSGMEDGVFGYRKGQAYAISYGQILGYIEQHGGSRTYMDLAQWYSGSFDVRYFDSVMESLVSLGYLTFRDDVYHLS